MISLKRVKGRTSHYRGKSLASLPPKAVEAGGLSGLRKGSETLSHQIPRHILKAMSRDVPHLMPNPTTLDTGAMHEEYPIISRCVEPLA